VFVIEIKPASPPYEDRVMPVFIAMFLRAAGSLIARMGATLAFIGRTSTAAAGAADRAAGTGLAPSAASSLRAGRVWRLSAEIKRDESFGETNATATWRPLLELGR
jgi:hypothetical protein